MDNIGGLGYKLTANVADFKTGMTLSRSELNLVRREMRDSRSDGEKLQQRLDTMTKAFQAGAIDVETYGRTFVRLNSETEHAKAAAKQYADEQKALAEQQRKAAELTERLATEEEKLAREFQKVAALKPHLSVEAHSRAIAELNRRTPEAIAQQQRLDQVQERRTRREQLLAREMERGRQVMRANETATERYQRQIADLNRLLQRGAIDLQTHGRAAAAARAEVERSTASNTNLVGSIRGLIGAYAGFHTIKKSISLAVEIEQAQASFEVLTGSAQSAAAVMADVRAFADSSPVSFSGAADAAKMMMAFNIPVQDVARNIRMLGDVSMGNQQRFDSLTLAFSQMSAAGRLMGQDLLQMINAGFNPLQEMSKRTGESLVELKARMEDGRISSQEVTDAFMSATMEGGRFHGMADRLADTMGGKLQIAMSNLEKLGARLGESFGPMVIAMTDGFNEGQSSIDSMISAVSTLTNGLTFLGMTITDVLSDGFLDKGFVKTSKFLDDLEAKEREAALRAKGDAKIVADQVATEVATQESKGAAIEKQVSEVERLIQIEKDLIFEMQNGKQAAEERRLLQDGATKADLERLQVLRQQTEELKRQSVETPKANDNTKKKKDPKTEREEELAQRGQALSIAMKTPFETFVAELADIKRLFDVGAINETTGRRAEAAARDRFSQSNRSDQPRSAPTATAGSTAAYDEIRRAAATASAKSDSIRQEQLAAQKAIQAAAEAQLLALKDLEPQVSL